MAPAKQTYRAVRDHDVPAAEIQVAEHERIRTQVYRLAGGFETPVEPTVQILKTAKSLRGSVISPQGPMRNPAANRPRYIAGESSKLGNHASQATRDIVDAKVEVREGFPGNVFHE